MLRNEVFTSLGDLAKTFVQVILESTNKLLFNGPQFFIMRKRSLCTFIDENPSEIALHSCALHMLVLI